MNTIKITTIIAVLVLIVGISYFLKMDVGESGIMSEEHHERASQLSHEIYPGDVVNKIKNNEDVVLLDVRTLEEYEQIHLENALLLPVQELSAKSLASIGLGEDAKNKEIIIYCRSGARSKTAYNIMESLGYTNIKSVSGGMIHWEEDQNPFTESGPYAGSPLGAGELKDLFVDGPKIVLSRTSHDFGAIPQFGGTVEAEFTVKNEGTETLVVGDITTSCSCTSAQISSSNIESGNEANLTVVFDPDFHEEPLDVFKRTVFIPTNDQNTPEAEVAITVDILEGE